LFGQSALPQKEIATVHVQGLIRGPLPGSVVPGAEINFESVEFHKNISANAKGFYEADLPLGRYRMSVEGPRSGLGGRVIFLKYVRPLFRITSPTNIVLNASLYPARVSCDVALTPPESGADSSVATRVDIAKMVCGGLDSFDAPANDGTPFQLYIQYPRSQPNANGYVYSSDRVTTNTRTPVLVAYNLFYLEANTVVYDVKTQTIEATGSVVTADGSGTTRHADSIRFKIENGEAFPLP
jgi:hypothetical protein